MRVLALGVVLALAACDGDSNGGPSPGPGTAPTPIVTGQNAVLVCEGYGWPLRSTVPVISISGDQATVGYPGHREATIPLSCLR